MADTSDDRTAATTKGAPASLAASLAPVSALLLSVALLLMGNGLQGTLVPIRANLEDFLPFEIGLLGTAYFAGFTFGCLNGSALVKRAGHIRTYLAMASLASAVPLVHAVDAHPLTWLLLRALTGYCFAVLYVVIESWLNERSTNSTRGTVFAVYSVINLTVIMAGQLMLGLASPDTFVLFALTSILVSVAALPIAFTEAASPATAQLVRPRLDRLYGISPAGVAGCIAVGLANGSFWALGPVFAQNRGLNPAEIGLFMSAVVLGGAVSQWPLGLLSDRMDRRIVMIGSSAVALVAALMLMVLPEADRTSMFAAGMLFGVGAFPLYPLAVAHANDYAEPTDYVEVSSGLLLLFGIGASIGPLLAALSRQFLTVQLLFYFTAAVHAVLIGYLVYRIRHRERPPAEARVDFTDAAIAAQTVTPFDTIGTMAGSDTPQSRDT